MTLLDEIRAIVSDGVFWTAVAAVGTIFTLLQIRRQIENAANVSAYTLIKQEDDRFITTESLRTRSNVARALLLGTTSQDLDASDDADTLLGMFEDLGSLVKARIVPARLAWTTGAFYVLRYWEALKDHIYWVRETQEDQTYYCEFEELYRRVRDIEEREARKKLPFPEHVINKFLVDELEGEPQPIKVRRARKSDLPRIQQIEALSFDGRYAYPREQFEDLYRAHSRSGFLVAELLKNKVVGYVVGYPVDGEGTIDSIAIEPSFEHMGVGRQLMLAILHSLKRAGLHRVSLEVRTADTLQQSTQLWSLIPKVAMPITEFFRRAALRLPFRKVRSSASRQIKFFTKLGFRQVGLLENYYGPGLDANRMELDL